jgi:hypothetical protein
VPIVLVVFEIGSFLEQVTIAKRYFFDKIEQSRCSVSADKITKIPQLHQMWCGKFDNKGAGWLDKLLGLLPRQLWR